VSHKLGNGRCRVTGKVRYPHKVDAVTAAGSMTKKKFVELRPYCCPSCHEWHLSKLRFAEGGRQS
jgi:hypothetical protein